jgi:hypothetical protein
MHGYGKFLQSIEEGQPGNSYKGDWFHGKKQGEGVETWSDGARYEGEY